MSTETRMTTPVCTLAFPKLVTPDSMNADDPVEKKKYSVELIFDEGEDLSGLKAAAHAAATAKWGNKIPKNLRSPFRDGSTDREGKDAYEGRTFFAARSKQRPRCVLRDGEGKYIGVAVDELDDTFYAGCKVAVNVTAFAYDTGSNGVGFFLNSILKVDDGERLGGSSGNVEDDFAGVDAAAFGEEVPF